MTRPRKRARSVAVIDIGSNSVRLVVYEAMGRSLITLFNEKALCGLGREVQSTGLLAPDAVAKALTSLRRFRATYSTVSLWSTAPRLSANGRACCLKGNA